MQTFLKNQKITKAPKNERIDSEDQSERTSKKTIQKYGTVHTPETLSQCIVEKTLHCILAGLNFKKNGKISIADPACGDGMLLQSMANLLSNKQKFKKISLCGLDIDKKALASCKQKLVKLDTRFKTTTINTDSLCLFGNSQKNKISKQLSKNIASDNKFDVIIANPPWGADLTDYEEKLSPTQYATLSGQANSFELFMEMATRMVRKGGCFAFIVPDSILNHGKSILRGILVETTEIKFIARLGEKIFPKISRACAIIICTNSFPSKNSQTDCFRLSSANRAQILAGQRSFSEAEIEHIHTVPQKRLLCNPRKQFDIDLREDETQLVKKFRKTSKTLADVLSSTRGVELGSSGMISKCANCHVWSPLSKNPINICKECGKKYNTENTQISITSQKKTPNSKPLITGSDLKRYAAKPSKWITLGKNGINYKSKDTFESPKILVRKIGVGITATLDYTYTYTNQVVYILRNNDRNNTELEFFIALINSKAYYFFLIKAFGELEWKSHPYLTQTQILGLPLPDLKSEKNQKIINEIVLLLRPRLKMGRPSKQIDMRVKSLIGKIFTLTKKDYEIIFDTINELDELLPVRELKNFDQNEFLSTLSSQARINGIWIHRF